MLRASGLILLCCCLPCWAGEIETARSLIKEGKHDEARTLLERTVKTPELKAESLILLTLLCNQRNDYEHGVEFGKQAVQLAPNSSEAHFQYAVALREELTKISKLKAMFRVGAYKDELARAIALDTANVMARTEQIGFLLNAPSVAGGSAEQAKQKIEELRRYDPRRATRFEVAILRKDGDVDGAIKVLRQLLEQSPDDYESRYTTGTLLQEAKRFKEADVEFSRLLEVKDPQLALAAEYQSARSRILGKYEPQKAVELLLNYIARHQDGTEGLPGKSPAYWRLGNAYEQLGQVSNARDAYRRALDLDGKNEEARKALEGLPKG